MMADIHVPGVSILHGAASVFCRIATKVTPGSSNARLTRPPERNDLFDLSSSRRWGAGAIES